MQALCAAKERRSLRGVRSRRDEARGSGRVAAAVEGTGAQHYDVRRAIIVVERVAGLCVVADCAQGRIELWSIGVD